MQISEWLLQQKMVERLFGPNCHHQVLRNANFMLEHLAKTFCFTTDHLDVMWSAALAQSYCFRQVMLMLKSIVPHLSLQLVKHLNSLISSLPINLHTHEVRNFTYVAARPLRYSSGYSSEEFS